MSTLIFPRDRPNDATYAGIAAQLEVGLIRIVQERRFGKDRRVVIGARQHGQRSEQRRKSYAWTFPIKVAL